MTMFSALGIPRHAIPAWLALSESLDRLAGEGRRPLCVQRPEQWGPDAKPAARRDAAEACGYCPALHPCAAFADAANEKHGVWGGVDRSLRPSKTRERKARMMRRTLPITVCERCRTTEASCEEKHARQALWCCPSCDHDGGSDA